MKLLLTALIAALAACQTTEPRAAGPAPHPVEARLVADTQNVQPGQTFTVGVVLKMKPGWHVYWKNPGDAGLPVSAELTGPEGFQIGEMQWPVPIRFTQPGDVVGYGYDDTVLFPFRVTAPARLDPGAPVRIAARLSWLVCEKVCIPGKATVDVSLPVGEPAPDNAKLFAEWIARLPVAAEGAKVEGRIDPATRRGTYTVVLDSKSPPAKVEFFPEADAAVAVDAPAVSIEGNRTRITFTVHIYEGQRPASERLPALVALTDAAGARSALTVSIPLQ